MVEAPKTLNGHKVIEAHHTPADRGTREGFVVLVDRACEFQPFVTAWAGLGDNSWCWGHYFQHESSAREDYDIRCKRGF